MFTVSTGASGTTLSSRVYERLSKGAYSSLECSCCLNGVRDSHLRSGGKRQFRIQLGELNIVRDIAVADIAEDAILGRDILVNSEMGPAELLLGSGIMLLGGKEIRFHQNKDSCRTPRLSVAGAVSLMAQSAVSGDNDCEIDMKTNGSLAVKSCGDNLPQEKITTLRNKNEVEHSKSAHIGTSATQLDLLRDTKKERDHHWEDHSLEVDPAEELQKVSGVDRRIALLERSNCSENLIRCSFKCVTLPPEGLKKINRIYWKQRSIDNDMSLSSRGVLGKRKYQHSVVHFKCMHRKHVFCLLKDNRQKLASCLWAKRVRPDSINMENAVFDPGGRLKKTIVVQ